MILFHEDWKKYPTAIADINTSNKSFVRLASVYREMGIKNHAFILALINPHLSGVDPHDPNLSPELQFAVAMECKINPWYFFREVVRVPPLAGQKAVPLEANRGNIALFFSFFNHIFIILIQIRQTGKSTSTDVLMCLLLNVLCVDTQINLLTKDDNLRRQNVERLKNIFDCLPEYLNMRTKYDSNNFEGLTVKELNNTYLTHVPQSSPKNAEKVGRGLTSPVFQVDEGPFQANIEIALGAALAAGGAAMEAAEQAGAPYGVIMTTTAGKKDDRDGKYMYDLLMSGAPWSEAFFDALNLAGLRDMVRKSSRDQKTELINATFNHRQLGKSDEWLEQRLARAKQKGENADRDFFNLWTSGTEAHPLSPDILGRIASSFMDVCYTSISRQGYLTRWYVPEKDIPRRMSQGHYVLGMDPSNASGGDAISLVLQDVVTLEVIAAGTYNETNLIVFSEWVCWLLLEYKNITAIIENRSSGQSVIDYLLLHLPLAGEDPFKRLFNRVVNDAADRPEDFDEIRLPASRRDPRLYNRFKKSFGFATSGSGVTSRTELYSTTLQNGAKRCGALIHDRMTIDQILGLTKRNGRIDHADGEHDDMVIGWLLCYWLLSLGTNLAYYGIDSRVIGSAMLLDSNVSYADLEQQAEQEQVRAKIDQVIEDLTNETDQNVAFLLERELRQLDRMLVLQQGDVFSVDELIRNVQESKRAKRLDSNRRFQSRDGGRDYYNAPSPQGYANIGVFANRPLGLDDFRHRRA